MTGDLVLPLVEKEHKLEVEVKQLKLYMVVPNVREKVVKNKLVRIILIVQVRNDVLYCYMINRKKSNNFNTSTKRMTLYLFL